MSRELMIRNRQRARAIDIALLRRITRSLLDIEWAVPSYELGIHLIPPTQMAEVNQHFLGHEGSTDVITFDHSEGQAAGAIHGELFISVSDAVNQAREFGTTWESELTRYIIHGLLHLRGFDDRDSDTRRRMKREENRLLRKVAAKFRLSHLARH